MEARIDHEIAGGNTDVAGGTRRCAWRFSFNQSVVKAVVAQRAVANGDDPAVRRPGCAPYR
jgi:hypothetical protein